MQEKTLARRLAASFGTHAASMVAQVLLQLVLVSVFLAHWSKEAYGEWLVLQAFAALFSLADLGVQSHLVNESRATLARGAVEPYVRQIRYGTFITAVLALAGLGLAALAFALDLPGLLGMTALEDAPTVLFLLTAAVLLAVPRNLLASVYSAHGDFAAEIRLGLALVATQFLAQTAAVAAGAAPVGVAWANLAATLVVGWGALCVHLLGRYGKLLRLPAPPTLEELGAVRRQAPFYLVPQSATVLLFNLPTMMMGHAGVPAHLVVAFTTMRTYVGLVRQVPQQMVTLACMEMSRQHARGDDAALGRLYTRAVRLSCGVTGVLAGFVVSAGGPFFAAWTHGEVHFDVALVAAFLLPFALSTPFLPAFTFLRQTDRARSVTGAYLVQCAAVVALGLFVLEHLGVAGLAALFCLAEAGAVTWFGLTGAPTAMRREAVHRLLPALALFLAAFTWSLFSAGIGLAPQPIESAADLLLFGILWSLAMAPALGFLLLDGRDRDQVAQRLRALIANR